MKRLVKTSLVVVVMFATIVSYANEFPLLTKERTKIVKNITFENVKEGSLLIIKDSNEIILYKELVEKSGTYSKGFDLTVLPNGNYYFELDKQVEIRVKPFMVKDSIVEFKKDEEYKIFKPVVYLKKDKVYISKFTFDNEVLDIKIFTADSHELVLSEKIERKGDSECLGRIYNFSTSEKGTYSIIINSAGRRFVKNIKI